MKKECYACATQRHACDCDEYNEQKENEDIITVIYDLFAAAFESNKSKSEIMKEQRDG